LLQVGGWLFYGLVFVIAASDASRDINLINLLTIGAESFFFLVITHTFRNLVIRWGWLKKSLIQLIPRVIASTLIIGEIIYLLRIATAYSLGNFDADLYSLGKIIGMPLTNSFIVMIWTILYFLYHYFERFNISLKYEAAVNEMLLNQLRAQLNPHFIFNALNSIRALVDEDPKKSKLAITQLSNILRTSLLADKKRLASFEEELKVVKDYLNLESIRYEERLNVSMDIDPSSKRFMIPPMMIQTLVENGIKHGISKLKKGGNLEIKTSVEGSYLTIEIRNSGKFLNGISRSSTGHGLKNTRDRLKLLYGDEATFDIRNAKDYVRTEVRIPQSI